jgi:hypothetical protein
MRRVLGRHCCQVLRLARPLHLNCYYTYLSVVPHVQALPSCTRRNTGTVLTATQTPSPQPSCSPALSVSCEGCLADTAAKCCAWRAHCSHPCLSRKP